MQGLRDVPGVQAAATSATLPGLSDSYPEALRLIEGHAATEKITGESKVVADGYSETMSIPILSGEGCANHTAWSTAVVNRSFAEAFAPHE